MTHFTHILIPIEEIEKYFEGCPHDMADFIELGKQISLDEKDIEEKAKESCINNFGEDTIEIHTFGYKQALLNLLK